MISSETHIMLLKKKQKTVKRVQCCCVFEPAGGSRDLDWKLQSAAVSSVLENDPVIKKAD